MDPESSECRPMTYCCPGEQQGIARAVHLARLAAGHLACRDCLHRHDTGSLPRHIVSRSRQRDGNIDFVLDSDEGLRGVYVNELTRERMARFTAHVIDMAHADLLKADDARSTSTGLIRVAVGFDFRASSADLIVGVVNALRQTGGQILDVGPVSRPAFDFAIQQLRPDIGLYVTGGLRPAAWNGLDLIDHAGLPWLTSDRQEQLTQTARHLPARLSRRSGRYEFVEILPDYRDRLSRQFHAIRPFRLGIACPSPELRSTLKQMLGQTQCSLAELPGRMTAAGEWRGRALTDLICDRHLDLGVEIAEDGRGCRIFDETGRQLTAQAVLKLLNSVEPDQDSFLSQSFTSETPEALTERDLRLWQQHSRQSCVTNQTGRYWFLEESPACDALQTLARVLEALSLTDRPASALCLH